MSTTLGIGVLIPGSEEEGDFEIEKISIYPELEKDFMEKHGTFPPIHSISFWELEKYLVELYPEISLEICTVETFRCGVVIFLSRTKNVFYDPITEFHGKIGGDITEDEIVMFQDIAKLLGIKCEISPYIVTSYL